MAIMFENVRFLNDETYNNLLEDFINDMGLSGNVLYEGAVEEPKGLEKFIFGKYGGEDSKVKELRSTLKDVIKANELDDSKLRSKGEGFLHTCKRGIQICLDLAGSALAGGTIGAVTGGTIATIMFGGIPAAAFIAVVLKPALRLLIAFICVKLLRLLVDKVEGARAKKDAKDIIKQLRDKASEINDDKMKKSLEEQADKLEKALEKEASKESKDDKKKD